VATDRDKNRKYNPTVGQIGGMHIVCMEALYAVSGDFCGFVFRRKCQLPHTAPVDIRLPDTKGRCGILAIIKDDFLGVKGEAELADHPFATGQIARGDNRAGLTCL